MSKDTSKTQMLKALRAAHADLETAIQSASEAEITAPGFNDEWSVKDLIAHLTFWERRAAFLLESAISGYRAEKDLWRTDSTDNLNEQNLRANQARPLADVLDDSRSVLATLISLLERLPEEYLAGEARFAWLDGRALGEMIAAETFGHIEEHWPDLQTWLAQQPR